MKSGRFIIGVLLGFFVFCLSAQSVNNDLTHKGKIKTLWVVDGVALNDSVFDYTLEQMQSDSASLLASSVLSWVYPHDIASISVTDSICAAEQGFVNCNGVVNIATTFREQIWFIINGLPTKAKEKVSAGEILGGYDYIQHIVKNEFGDLADYGIKDFVILKQFPINWHNHRIPYVVVTTELPYYRTEHLIGRYTGKQGRKSYELKLNSDSSYVFSKTDSHKKAFTPEIRNYGKWGISSGKISLISSQDPIIRLQGYTVSLDTVRLEIKTVRALTLPKGSWYNKKSVTLKRQHDETDRM